MRIDTPCPDGSAIRSIDGSLHCSLCESEVIDLREVTERRARALVAAARFESGRVCARMFTDGHGNPSFLLEPPRERSRLPIVEVALVASLATACGASGSGATEAPTTMHPADAPAESCERPAHAAVPSTSPGVRETPPAEGPPEITSTPGTPAHPQTNAPRTHPADVEVDGGLG